MAETKTILVVDDIPLIRTMLVKYIKVLGEKILKESNDAGGIDVIEAGSGRIALEKLKERRVDLVFLDLMMPDMDGLAFLGAQREDPTIREIPVIICSAIAEKETIDKAKALGARSYIMKPFTLKTIEENIRQAIDLVRP